MKQKIYLDFFTVLKVLFWSASQVHPELHISLNSDSTIYSILLWLLVLSFCLKCVFPEAIAG